MKFKYIHVFVQIIDNESNDLTRYACYNISK